MNRSRWTAAMGIVLAAGITAGGLFFMEYMLTERRTALFSEGGKVKAVLSVRETESSAGRRVSLSEEELTEILLSMESGETEQPHEPIGAQLTMEQAVERGKEWLEALCGDYLGEEMSGKYERIYAELCVKTDGYAESGLSRELFSYWTVMLNAREMRAELAMNAVTGQVLNAALYAYLPGFAFSEIDRERLLEEYCSSFGLEMDDLLWIRDGMLWRSLGNGNLFAGVKTEDFAIADADQEEHLDVSMLQLRLYAVYSDKKVVIDKSDTTK